MSIDPYPSNYTTFFANGQKKELIQFVTFLLTLWPESLNLITRIE